MAVYDHTLQKIRPYFNHPATRWVITLLWTAVATSLMLSPSGEGTTVHWLSSLLGRTDQGDAVGHMIINVVLAFLWYWSLLLYFPPQKTYVIVLLFGFCWGFSVELLQIFIPNRGSTLLDLAANNLGVFICTLPHWLFQRRETQA